MKRIAIHRSALCSADSLSRLNGSSQGIEDFSRVAEKAGIILLNLPTTNAANRSGHQHLRIDYERNITACCCRRSTKSCSLAVKLVA